MVSYPIPLEMSIPRKGIMFSMAAKAKTPESKQLLDVRIAHMNADYIKLVDELKAGQNLLQMEDDAHPDGYTVRGLLDEMAMGDTLQAKLALATLLTLMYNRLQKNMKEVEEFRADINQMMFSVFEAALRMSREEIVPALEVNPAQSLERLYPIKFLDAL